MTTPAPQTAAPQASLRQTMLRRLAAPLSILALASGTFAYWLAWQYTAHVVDRSLVDLANAVAQQVRISGEQAAQSVPPLAQAMFSDPVDQLVYRVNREGKELAGDATLPMTGSGIVVVNEATVYDARFNGTDVRIAQVRVQDAHGGHAVIEVGQRVERRLRLAAEFLLAIMTPLLVLLVAGWLIVWRVVNQQLIPLTVLADSLNRQTHTSLEPVDETYVPLEIRPLTSALNALLERLGKALDAQRKFIADAAHQLRTPLTAVKLHADQAATARDPQRVATAVQELRASADRAVRLSNQLLSLARADPSEQIARFVVVNITTLAFETGAEWVPRSLARRIDLGFDSWPEASIDVDPSAEGLNNAGGDLVGHPDSDPLGIPDHEYVVVTGSPAVPQLEVKGNPILLREVLANLIDNALKYVPPSRPDDGRVTVRVGRVTERTNKPFTERLKANTFGNLTPRTDPRIDPHIDPHIGSQIDPHEAAFVELVVEDNGPGVGISAQNELFERFFRGDATHASEGGAGLGLAIVRDIIRLHNGTVRYQDAPGGGSRFIVRLPLLPART